MYTVFCIQYLAYTSKSLATPFRSHSIATTASMTQKIGAVARSVANPGTEIIACNPEMGHYDEALSVVGILDEIRKGEAEGVDGYVIALVEDG